MAFNTTINTLSGNASFYDWFTKENNEIISKLNQCTISGVTSGDGVLVSLNASTGVATLSVGGTSGTITKGLTFNGSIVFSGETIIPNISYKISGITSGTSGYSFGSVIRITTNGYTAAKANSPDNAEVIGIISNRTSTYSTVVLAGKIDGDFSYVAGGTLSPGCIYFLDTGTAGFITTTEPITLGQVSKPVLVGIGATSGVVLQYRGNYLNSTSGGGSCGSNKLFITLPSTPTDPRNHGYSAGVFLSYAPDVVAGNTFFNGILAETGRTAINGWFLSGSANYLHQLHDVGSEPDYFNIPNEDDFIVGMVENITPGGGSDLVYQIITNGSTVVIPQSISSFAGSAKGTWMIGGRTADLQISSAGVTQLSQLPADVSSFTFNPLYQVGMAFDDNPNSWFVNIKPFSFLTPISTLNAPRSGAVNISNGLNYAYNGDYSVWQRDIGKISQYTSPGNLYYADSWIRRESGITNGIQFIERKTFPITSAEVEGSPEHYVDLKCLADPAFAQPGNNMVYSVGHVIDDIQTFNNTNITVSFYAKATLGSYSANVYFARYANNTLISKEVIGTIALYTSWTKHSLQYTVPTISAGTYNDSYVEIGIDLKPLVRAAHTNSISTGTNLVASLASMTVYAGSFTTPVHIFETYDQKLKKAQKYYYTTYSEDQTTGSKTMDTMSDPTLNVHTFQYLPGFPYNMFKLPVKQRASPTVTIYSPTGTISFPEIYNYTANRDLKNTSGTKGYNGENRIFASFSGTPTVSTSQNDTTIRINVNGGAVPYDVLACHIVADSSYPI